MLDISQIGIVPVILIWIIILHLVYKFDFDGLLKLRMENHIWILAVHPAKHADLIIKKVGIIWWYKRNFFDPTT
jgi:hypothetical protein